jgi:predicted GIY-YIG superfamily endonuclease
MTQTLYRHFDASDNLLYIGVSSRISQRIKEHSMHSSWWQNVSKITLEHFETRKEVLEAERNAIIAEKPRHNIKHKNGKIKDVKESVEYSDYRGRLLTARLVEIPIMLSVTNWSIQLGIPKTYLQSAIEKNELGYVTIGAGGPQKTPRLWCTGWQIIDWLENTNLKPDAEIVR